MRKNLKRHKVWLFLSVLFLIVLSAKLGSAQINLDGEYEAPPDSEVKNALQFTQGVKIYEDWFTTFFDGWEETVWEEWSMFIDIAIALAALTTLMFFGGRAYGMMTGDKKWEILPLLKPFGMLMIILNWQIFIGLIKVPINGMVQHLKEKNEAQQTQLTDLRIVRYEYQKALVDNIYLLAAEAEQAEKETEKVDENIFTSSMKEFWNKIEAPIKQFTFRMRFMMTMMMTIMIETLAFWVLRIALYVVLAFQVVFSGILLIFGPITVALSILPGFADSFNTWVARFISVNLYHVIALMNMYIGGIFVEHALKSEIIKYKELIFRDGTPAADLGEKLFWLAGNGIISFGTVIVAFLVTAALMFTVPSISNMIVNASGMSHGIGHAARGGARMIGMGTRRIGSFIRK